MAQIFIDADACPVKEEAVRVAERHRLPVKMVSNGGIRPHRNPLVETVVVPEGPDAADDWIAERAGPGDIVVTADILLAGRCVKAGAAVLKPNGEALTEDGIGMAVAMRNLMTDLREAGTVAGYNAGFTKKDRSRFLEALEAAARKAGR